MAELQDAFAGGFAEKFEGKDYIFSPLTLNDFCELETVIGPISNLELMSSFSANRYILFLSLRRKHPELTIEMVGNLIPPGEMANLVDRVTKLSMGKRPKKGE